MFNFNLIFFQHKAKKKNNRENETRSPGEKIKEKLPKKGSNKGREKNKWIAFMAELEGGKKINEIK